MPGVTLPHASWSNQPQYGSREAIHALAREKPQKNHASFTSFLRNAGALALRGVQEQSRTFYKTRDAHTDSGEF